MTKDQIIKELKVQFAVLQELQKKNKNVLQYLPADLKLAIKEAREELKMSKEKANNDEEQQETIVYEDAIVATDDIAMQFRQQDVPGDSIKRLTGDMEKEMREICVANTDWNFNNILALALDKKGTNIGIDIHNFMASFPFSNKYKKIIVTAVDKIYICTYENVGSPAK